MGEMFGSSPITGESGPDFEEEVIVVAESKGHSLDDLDLVEECVGCNLCAAVCPVEGCIEMVQLTSGTDPRTGKPIDNRYANWTTHPNNPNRVAAE